jgi:N-acetylmuramoyl-L-alanine amidase
VAIDAGHQQNGNNEQEAIGPGAPETKAKVASGTRGVSSGVAEYKLTLAVARKLRDALKAQGYQVVMIRETDDVNISNKERAAMAEEAGADIFVRIHANGSTDQSAHGMLMVAPTKNSPYIPDLYEDSRRLALALLDEMEAETGANRRGIWETDSMSGINWATMPVVLVEMGYMTNPAEDELMQTDDYQNKLVTGMVNGIDRYYEGE